MNIRDLDLPVEITNTLHRAKITTVELLRTKTPRELLKIRNLGPVRVKQILSSAEVTPNLELDITEEFKEEFKRRPIGERTLYECFNAKVLGDLIYCKVGHRLGGYHDGIHIRRLIKGDPLRLSSCQDCPDFIQMDPQGYFEKDRGWEPTEEELDRLRSPRLLRARLISGAEL